jgi:hypothetical protein
VKVFFGLSWKLNRGRDCILTEKDMTQIMDYSKLSKYCIYTMKNSKELDNIFNSDRRGKFYENRLWKAGELLFDESRNQNLLMPILFSAAEVNSGLIYYGVLTSVILLEKDNKTEYSFKDLTKIAMPKPLSALYLKTSKKPMSNNYIRPYAICLTPLNLSKWAQSDKLLSLYKSKKSGEEHFHYDFKKLNFTLKNFWQWAYSDLVGNVRRGILAEYIVAEALNLTDKVRTEWDAFDLLTEKGLKIEVKSAAYIQSWRQKDYSKIRFSIRKTKYYDENTIIETQEPKRQADIYIFCLLKHKVQETLDPLDLEQWNFYILPTNIIDKEMKGNKEITLKKLLNLKPIESNFSNLKKNVELLEKRLCDGNS